MADTPKNNGGNVNGGTRGGYVPGQPRPYQKPGKPATQIDRPTGGTINQWGARVDPNPRNEAGKSKPDYADAHDR